MQKYPFLVSGRYEMAYNSLTKSLTPQLLPGSKNHTYDLIDPGVYDEKGADIRETLNPEIWPPSLDEQLDSILFLSGGAITEINLISWLSYHKKNSESVNEMITLLHSKYAEGKTRMGQRNIGRSGTWEIFDKDKLRLLKKWIAENKSDPENDTTEETVRKILSPLMEDYHDQQPILGKKEFEFLVQELTKFIQDHEYTVYDKSQTIIPNCPNEVFYPHLYCVYYRYKSKGITIKRLAEFLFDIIRSNKLQDEKGLPARLHISSLETLIKKGASSQNIRLKKP